MSALTHEKTDDSECKQQEEDVGELTQGILDFLDDSSVQSAL